VKNLLAQYKLNEISGQVFILNPRNDAQSSFKFAQSSVKLPEGLYQIRARILEGETNPKPLKEVDFSHYFLN